MDHTDSAKEDDQEIMRKAAMVLCAMVSNHEIECTCNGCEIASLAAPLLPKMRQSFRQQFDQKRAFHDRIGRNLK